MSLAVSTRHLETIGNLTTIVDHISLCTVLPRIVRTRSINFTAVMLRGQFEGALYSRARFNTD